VQLSQDVQNFGGRRPNRFVNFKTTSELFTSSHSFKRNFDGSLITEAPAPVLLVGASAPAPAPAVLAGAPASAPAPAVLSGDFASAPAPAPVGSGLIQFHAGKNNQMFDKKKNQKSELDDSSFIQNNRNFGKNKESESNEKSESSLAFDKGRNDKSSLLFRRNMTLINQNHIAKHRKQSGDGWCRTTMGDEGVYGCWELAQSVGMAGADHLQIVNQVNSMPCATSFPKSDDIMVYPCSEVSDSNDKNGKDYDKERLEDEMKEKEESLAGLSEKSSTSEKHHYHKHHGHHSSHHW